jgi:uncharacterized protein (TIGR02231 family)
VRELDNQQRTLNRRLDKLRQELKQIQSARPKQRFRAKVEVSVQSEGDFRLELTYVVTQAGWQPLYDLRLSETENGRTMELSYIAQVTQQTGQDWRGVDLVVSTARPALNQRLPELHPWYLSVYTPPPPAAKLKEGAMAVRSAAPAPQMMAMAAADAAMPAEMAERVADVAVATVQESGTAVSFIVPGKTDIPSDGSPHKTTINRFQLDPELEYLSVPKHTGAVFRRVKVS